MPIIDVTPEKRLYLSIISEYDIPKSICELVDNAIDLWTKDRRRNLEIKIVMEVRRQLISIEDNSGGIQEGKLDHIISPGKTTNDIRDDVIGYFGIGSKRAVVALAEDVTIHSRFARQQTFAFRFDNYWISEDPKWELEYKPSNKSLAPNTTLIELSKLRVELTQDEISNLKDHLGEVYSQFIHQGVKIILNGKAIDPIRFDKDWAFPATFSPMTFKGQIPLDGRSVDVEMTAGLINHSGDPDNSYGVFFYCNNRLITRALNDFSVGFVPGLVGNPHFNISLVRTIVNLNGQSRDMPWNSSKTGLDTKHPVFQALRGSIIDVTNRFSKVCRGLQGKWEEEVFPFTKGKVKEETLETITDIPKGYLPTPPASKPKWHQKVQKRNAKIVKEKNWAEGLQDSIIAVDIISKTSLSQKNRIALILLDSTLEIAYKEYLANEQGIGMDSFKKIADNRSLVQDKVLEKIKVPEATLKKINHYYRMRNNLIHQRATPNVGDDEVKEYRKIVEALLNKMFKLKFTSN